MKIYFAFPLPASDQPLLASLTTGDEVWQADPTAATEADRRAFLEAEIVFGSFPEELLQSAPSLRWIQLASAGVDNFRHLDWSRVAGQITCTNMRGVFAEPMAQTVLGGLLALTRGIDEFVQLKTGHDWQKNRLHPRLRRIDGTRVLLLGAGSVNRRLRELLTPFGCNFTTFGRTSGDIHSPAELDAALPHADIVVAALPETDETRGLINEARLAHFKTGALFANVGRGSLVDEAALVEALRSGRLGGALLDVTKNEPLPPDDPLWTCPRLILTQHTCGGSDRVFRDSLEFFGANLARYRNRQPLLNVVDWTRGY